MTSGGAGSSSGGGGGGAAARESELQRLQSFNAELPEPPKPESREAGTVTRGLFPRRDPRQERENAGREAGIGAAQPLLSKKS
eukprot:superscaffoldBa00003671_g17464